MGKTIASNFVATQVPSSLFFRMHHVENMPFFYVWISLLEKCIFNELHRCEHLLCFCNEIISLKINYSKQIEHMKRK